MTDFVGTRDDQQAGGVRCEQVLQRLHGRLFSQAGKRLWLELADRHLALFEVGHRVSRQRGQHKGTVFGARRREWRNRVQARRRDDRCGSNGDVARKAMP
ncbi:MAG: hypothetical protein H7Z19_21490 [Chitinophagaceae bacterium]|nr:hypothetical protein [Rubrivivax sp.]